MTGSGGEVVELIPLSLHRAQMGVTFGTDKGTFGRGLWSPPPCQISPPSVQRVAPSGRKTSKSASE